MNWKKKKSGGIKIICQSEMRDFSAMAFITDHVNSLIDQWFPGERMFLNQVFAHVNISLYIRAGFLIWGTESHWDSAQGNQRGPNSPLAES